jgi:methylamine dehydrogenase light chain
MKKKWSDILHHATFESGVRRIARQTSRRGFLATAGRWLVAAAAFPLLPIDRTNVARAATPAFSKDSFAAHAQTTDEDKCNYWRYCSIDGTLCSCCGGTADSCPAGTVSPPSSWVGSCINPEDGQTYLVAYRDCCGKAVCSRCGCRSTEGDVPVYRPQTNQDIVWCFGTDQMMYHCSISNIVAKI